MQREPLPKASSCSQASAPPRASAVVRLPFTASFAAAWCGLTDDEARRGLAELRRTGWLEPTGPSQAGTGYTYERPR